MKIEVRDKEGKVVDTIVGGKQWIAEILDDRLLDLQSVHGDGLTKREVPDDTPGLLKTLDGRPFWMGRL